jgi:glutathione synthase/RimK-type ligase-like ATP-grasp enzyme
MTILFVRRRGHAPELRNNFRTITEETISNFSSPQNTVYWRWGTLVGLPDPQINSRDACITAANKPTIRQICTREKIRIPTTYYTAEEARTHFNISTAPLLWRPRSHQAGQDMVVINSVDEVRHATGYWSIILTKTNEYRVYVLFGKVIGVDEKIVSDKTQLAWNHSQGGYFTVLPWDSWPSKACWFSTKLASAIGLHFGAFDLIKSEGRLYMLEVNTSPAMTTVYKSNLLHRAVNWLENELTAHGNLPTIVSPLPECLRGYNHYIHPLHINESRG